MRVHIVQKDINNTDHESFLDGLDSASVDLVCFGELSATGCIYRPEQIPSLDETLKSLSRYDFGVMLGFPVRTPEGLFNGYLYHRRGACRIYRKMNLFAPMNEDRIYRPGNEIGLFQTDLGRFGVAICYDLRFPEIFRALRDAGARLLFVPAAFPRVRVGDWKALLVQRAVETGLTVIGINAVGADSANEFGGSSMVVDGHGRVLAQAGETEEIVLAVEV